MVIRCCTTLQKIFDTITADTGLSKGHKEDVHYMDEKEHAKDFCEKCNVGLLSDCFKKIPYSLNIVNINVYTTHCTKNEVFH